MCVCVCVCGGGGGGGGVGGRGLRGIGSLRWRASNVHKKTILIVTDEVFFASDIGEMFYDWALLSSHIPENWQTSLADTTIADNSVSIYRPQRLTRKEKKKRKKKEKKKNLKQERLLVLF